MRRTPVQAHPLSTGLGLVMAAAAGVHSAGVGFVVAVLAVLAVLMGIRFRRVGTLAVLLAAAAMTLTGAEPLVTGLAGLCAACYLVLLHTEEAVPAGASSPAMGAALGLALVGVLAASFPSELPWLPLLAPLAVFAVFMLAIWPYFFVADRGEADLGSRS